MKIVFIGAVRFSASMLDVLLEMKAEIVGVCALLQSSENADYVDLSEQAHRAGIPAFYTSDINNLETIEWISRLAPDIIFCIGWSRLIKRQLLDLAPLGVIGYHPSALPANRGRHPLIWALSLGLNETASTFFFMDDGADSGDIVSQVSVPIYFVDNAASLYERITDVASYQMRKLVGDIGSGNYIRMPQNGSISNYWRKRERMDGQIDWRMSATAIYDLVRALSFPYPGAHFIYHGREVKVWKVEPVKHASRNLEPGKVLAVEPNGILIKAGEGAVKLIVIEPILSLHPGDYL